MAIEESQQKRTNMGSIDVGVSHDNDFMIAQFFQIKAICANAAAQGRDHRPHFFVLQNFFKTRFFNV